MTIEDILLQSTSPSRRDFLKTSGMLVVGVGATAVVGPFVRSRDRAGARAVSGPDFRKLDSWIVIHEEHGDPSMSARRTAARERHGVPSDDGRRARHRLQGHHLHHGDGPTSPSTRGVWRVGRHTDRRVADAPRRGGRTSRAPRDGVDPV